MKRLPAGLLLPIGPACVAVIRFVIPGGSGDVGAEVAADPGAQRLVLLLGLPALFTLLPGAYAALRITRPHRPRLTAWAGGLLIPGYLAMTVLAAGDNAVMAGHDIGLPPATVTRLSDEIMSLTAVPVLVFVVGHIAGTILLGLAAWGLVPKWASAALIVSQPLHLLAVVVTAPWLDLFGWGLTAVGMAALALRGGRPVPAPAAAAT